MPQRDDNDYERRRQQIIDGALQVFASKGFETATTKDIAKAAGVKSPGLIYHYFADKADLFRHVIEQRVPVVELFDQLDAFSALAPRKALDHVRARPAQRDQLATDAGDDAADDGRVDPAPCRRGNVEPARPRTGLRLSDHISGAPDGGWNAPAHGARRRDTLFRRPALCLYSHQLVFPQPDSATLTAEAMAAAAVDVFLRGMGRPTSVTLSDRPPDGAILWYTLRA